MKDEDDDDDDDIKWNRFVRLWIVVAVFNGTHSFKLLNIYKPKKIFS